MRQCIQGIRPYFARWTGEDLVSALQKWKKFVDQHGIEPTGCETPEFGNLKSWTYSAYDIVHQEPNFCEVFPDCPHQQLHLKMQFAERVELLDLWTGGRTN